MLKLITLLCLCCFTFIKVYTQTQTLEYYIHQGLQNSPLLKDYQNQINASIIDSSILRAARRPQVDARAQILYAPSYRLWGYDEAITNNGNYTSVIEASQSFFNGKEVKNKYESLSIQKRSLANTSKITINDLRRQITNQYISVYADYSDLSFNESFLKLMHEQETVIKRLVENAIYKQTDYLSLAIERQTQEILVKQLRNQFEKDLNQLKVLCGINDTNRVVLTTPSIEQVKPADLSLSPLIIQYKIDSLKIVNDRTSVDLQYRPKLNWFADAGLNTSPSDPFRHFGYSAGINFSLPIYDGNQRKLQYQKFTFTENTRSNYEAYYRNQYFQQIKQLNKDLATIQETSNELKAQLISANELITLAKAQLNAGNMQIADFINALKNYITINRDLNRSQINTLQIINELNYLLQQ
jgi:outer membrane protein TolC